LANLLQASWINRHRTVETEARSFQDDFERQHSLFRGRLVALRDICLDGLGRLRFRRADLLRRGAGRGGLDNLICIRSGYDGLGVVRGAIGKQASADRGVELVDRARVDLVEWRGDRERTRAAKRR
jgi:hypothetical protein